MRFGIMAMQIGALIPSGGRPRICWRTPSASIMPA